nr:hypothetical protein [Streptomyces sp. F12]
MTMNKRLVDRIRRLTRRLRLPRLRNLMIPIVGLYTTMVVLAPAAAADDTDKYAPAGIGDLMPSPITPPHGQHTLFETYAPSAYQLDKQLSDDLFGGDLIDGSMYEICQMLMGVLTMVGRATVTIVQWSFQVVRLPEVEPAISKAIGAAATPMAETFLPAAVALGMFIAWARRSDSSMLGQLAWVAASAAIATTFFTSPSTWVKGVDNARQAGSTVAMTTINGGLSGDTSDSLPFKTPTPTWSGNAKDDAIRKASDAVWRTYVATPWCLADLGSIEACKRWGPEVIKLGSDMEDRETYLKDHMTTDAAGHDAVEWRQGHTPSGRIGLLIAALISAVIFAVLALTLAAATLASLLGSLMLLVCGVVFAALWCIPGKPRQWGVGWFETLIGLTLVSFTGTMLLGATMITSLALLTLLPSFGWLMVSCLNVACAGMAIKLKGRLDGIVSGGGAQLAGRGILNAAGQFAATSRLRKAMGNASSGGGRGGLFDVLRDRFPGGINLPRAPRLPRRSPAPTPQPAEDDTSITVERVRTYPPPPSRPRLPSGTYGDHAATRPGLPGGPGTPPSAGTPGSDKAAAARQRAGQAGPYQVRYGAPDPSGVPPHPRQSGTKTIQGEVVRDEPANPVGAKFRSYPPPASGRVITGSVVRDKPAPAPRPEIRQKARPALPPAKGDS